MPISCRLHTWGEKEFLISFSVAKREAIHNFFYSSVDGDDVCDLSYKTPAIRTFTTCLPLKRVDMINLLVLCRCGVEEESSLRRVLEINQGCFCLSGREYIILPSSKKLQRVCMVLCSWYVNLDLLTRHGLVLYRLAVSFWLQYLQFLWCSWESFVFFVLGRWRQGNYN